MSHTRVAFVSLGCPKNLVDSENMLGLLQESGFELVSEGDEADVMVINTCGFLEAATEESLGVIHDAIERKQAGQLKRVVVAGCLVQRQRAKLLEQAPGIDALIGVYDRDQIVNAVQIETPQRADLSEDQPRYWIAANALQAAKERGRQTAGLTVHGADGRGVGYFEDDTTRYRLTPRHWAYLRISEGCNQKCSFCTIPSIRGKMRSKPIDSILAEAQQLLMDGACELNLIGQDTTSYGRDVGYDKSGEGLVGLLTTLNQLVEEHGPAAQLVDGPRCWVRLMYAYPTHLTDDIIDVIADLPHITKYLDIPLQHISDSMLTNMRRNITQAAQDQLLTKLRSRIPSLALRTTLITGFPGETDEDHRQLLEFVEENQFDMLGVFQYSREEGTVAGTMDQDPALHVPDEVKAQREAELMLTQQRIAFENAQYLAQQQCQFDVLIDGVADTDIYTQENDGESAPGVWYVGRCYHQAPEVDTSTYVFSTEPLSPGEFVRCTIVDAEEYDLLAQPTEQLEGSIGLPVIS